MTLFQPKHGVPGWPGPQARRLAHWCDRYGIEYSLHIADSGTHYYTLWPSEGQEIIVRVADHAEAPRGRKSPDYTIDPFVDQWSSVKAWIKAHGVAPRRWGPKIAARIAERMRQLLGDLPDVEVEILRYADHMVRAGRGTRATVHCTRRGLWYSPDCADDIRERLRPLAYLEWKENENDETE